MMLQTPPSNRTPWGRKNMIRIDTPAMPLNDGRFGGFFDSILRKLRLRAVAHVFRPTLLLAQASTFFSSKRLKINVVPFPAQSLLNRETCPTLRDNIPAMPLNDAQIGGFFYARSARA